MLTWCFMRSKWKSKEAHVCKYFFSFISKSAYLANRTLQRWCASEQQLCVKFGLTLWLGAPPLSFLGKGGTDCYRIISTFSQLFQLPFEHNHSAKVQEMTTLNCALRGKKLRKLALCKSVWKFNPMTTMKKLPSMMWSYMNIRTF